MDIQIICPYFLNSLIREFNDKTTIYEFYNNLYKRYVKFEDDG